MSKPLRVPTPESGHPAAYGSIGKGRRRVILLGFDRLDRHPGAGRHRRPPRPVRGRRPGRGRIQPGPVRRAGRRPSVRHARLGRAGIWPADGPDRSSPASGRATELVEAIGRRRRAQRHHRLDRAGTHPRRAATPAGPWPWPTRNRWSPAAPWSPRPPRPGRSCRSTPNTAPWPSACAAAHRTRSRGWWSPPRVVRSAAGPGRRWRTSPPTQALAHPTWSMGPVVTINSATLVNKGLEVIEAHLLFDIPYERIDVVVHPQSVIHSMVTFVDGSTIAQASPPDMRLPIALALAWPHRLDRVARGLRLRRRRPPGRSSRSTARRFRRWTSPAPRGGPAARFRPRSTPPTRRRLTPSAPVSCVSQVSPTSWHASWTRPTTRGATRGTCTTSGPRKTGPGDGPARSSPERPPGSRWGSSAWGPV